MLTQEVFEEITARRVAVQNSEELDPDSKWHRRKEAEIDEGQKLGAEGPGAGEESPRSRVGLFSDDEIVELGHQRMDDREDEAFLRLIRASGL